MPVTRASMASMHGVRPSQQSQLPPPGPASNRSAIRPDRQSQASRAIAHRRSRVRCPP